jgi:hypothetical protein
MKIQKSFVLISLLLVLVSEALSAGTNHDDPKWFQRPSWNAFISQSAIYSSDYNFLSQSDDALSFDMWEAGLLFSTDIISEITFSSQLLGRQVSRSSGNDLRVDYAFFSYSFYRSMHDAIGVRIGRIRSSYGFYNETRDIPHTRTGIVMPQSIYFDMTRNSFYSADGIEFFGYKDFGDERFSAQIFISKPLEDDDEAAEASQLQPRNLNGDQSLLAKISYGSEFDGVRAAFTYYRPEYEVGVTDFQVSPGSFVSDENASFYSESMLASIEYNQLDWSITAEYLRHKFQPTVTSIKLPLYEESFYIQGLYRFNDQFESYLRYDTTSPHTSASVDKAYKWSDINVGATFRPNDNWLLRAEFHYIEGLFRLLNRDNTYGVDQDPYWTAAMFQIAYKW